MSKEKRWEEVLPPERWIRKKPASHYRCRDGHTYTLPVIAEIKVTDYPQKAAVFAKQASERM